MKIKVITKQIELTNEQKAKLVKNNFKRILINKIRKKYSIDDEIAIIRQKDTKPEEFKEYNEYVENSKKEIKEKLKIE